ncbi:MAG: protein kinase [Legionella sp.]|nr:protein kinase [Legionella sp.]
MPSTIEYHELSLEESRALARDYFASNDLSKDHIKLERTKHNGNELTGPIYYWQGRLCLLPVSYFRVNSTLYEVEATIGAGSFGKVKRVNPFDEINENKRVIKVQQVVDNKDNLINTDKSPDLVIKEVRMMKRIYSDVENWQMNKKSYIISPFLGMPLSRYLAEHSLSLDEKLVLSIKMWIKIAQLHIKKLIHYDIKTENMVVELDASGELNLNIIDFGLSEDVGTTRKALNGTPAYFPPDARSYNTSAYPKEFFDCFAGSRVCYLPPAFWRIYKPKKNQEDKKRVAGVPLNKNELTENKQIVCKEVAVHKPTNFAEKDRLINVPNGVLSNRKNTLSIFNDADIQENEALAQLFKENVAEKKIEQLPTALEFAIALTTIRFENAGKQMDSTLRSIDDIEEANKTLQVILRSQSQSHLSQNKDIDIEKNEVLEKSLLSDSRALFARSNASAYLKKNSLPASEENVEFLIKYPGLASILTTVNLPLIKTLAKSFEEKNCYLDKSILTHIKAFAKQKALTVENVYITVIEELRLKLFKIAGQIVTKQRINNADYNIIKGCDSGKREDIQKIDNLLFDLLALLTRRKLPLSIINIHAAYILTCQRRQHAKRIDLSADEIEKNQPITVNEIIELKHLLWDIKHTKFKEDMDLLINNQRIIGQAISDEYEKVLQEKKHEDRAHSKIGFWGELKAMCRNKGKKTLQQKLDKIQTLLERNEIPKTRTYMVLEKLGFIVEIQGDKSLHPLIFLSFIKKDARIQVVLNKESKITLSP